MYRALLIAVAISLSPNVAAASPLDEKLAALAERGDAEAAYHLGMLYNNGIGVPHDAAVALRWFRRAADKGDALGAYKLGCYYDGQGDDVLTPDAAAALRYKLIAARAGYSLAQDDVAAHYLAAGESTAALRWLEAAGAQGDATALLRLTMLSLTSPAAVTPISGYIAFAKLVHLVGGEPNEEMKIQLDALRKRLNDDERADADREIKAYEPRPTALTLKAREGLDAARRIAGID